MLFNGEVGSAGYQLVHLTWLELGPTRLQRHLEASDTKSASESAPARSQQPSQDMGSGAHANAYIQSETCNSHATENEQELLPVSALQDADGLGTDRWYDNITEMKQLPLTSFTTINRHNDNFGTWIKLRKAFPLPSDPPTLPFPHPGPDPKTNAGSPFFFRLQSLYSL